MGFFDKIKQSLTRTKEQIVERFDEIVRQARRAGTPQPAGRRRDDRSARRAADLGRRRRRRDRADHRAPFVRGTARRRCCATWSRRRSSAIFAGRRHAGAERPRAAGRADRRRQRHGKTTTVGKLAQPAQGRRASTPLICAADTFRAAAVEQLEIWATRAGVDIIRAQDGRRSGGGRLRRDRRRARRKGAIRCSSTPPAGCTRAST